MVKLGLQKGEYFLEILENFWKLWKDSENNPM